MTKRTVGIIGRGFDAEAQVIALQEKLGEDTRVVLIDGRSEPMPIIPQPAVYDYEMVGRSIYEDLYKVSKSDRRGTVCSVRNSVEEPKIQRNNPCPCNSGKKYKKCCEGKK